MKRKSTFEGGYVPPGQNSPLVLSEGIFSLSSLCNVPYVEFLGTGGFRKVISWGEVAEIPCDETVTVRNASYHGGTLVVNAGVDPDPRPARITVPLRIHAPGEFGPPPFTDFVDTRRARRAYIALGLPAEDTAYGIVAYGVSMSSHDTQSDLPLGNPGPGYEEGFVILPLEIPGPIPLGYRSRLGDDSTPHALLDMARVQLDRLITVGTAYGILEY